MLEAQVEILAALDMLHVTRGIYYSFNVYFEGKEIILKFNAFSDAGSINDSLILNTTDSFFRAKEITKKLLYKYL